MDKKGVVTGDPLGDSHKTKLVGSVNDPLTVQLVCTKIPYQSIYGREELNTFVVAGQETTSSWCTWCSFVLCKYPDVQQKAYADI